MKVWDFIRKTGARTNGVYVIREGFTDRVEVPINRFRGALRRELMTWDAGRGLIDRNVGFFTILPDPDRDGVKIILHI